MKAGEIVIFDKGYLDFAHLAELSARGVFRVTSSCVTTIPARRLAIASLNVAPRESISRR